MIVASVARACIFPLHACGVQVLARVLIHINVLLERFGCAFTVNVRVCVCVAHALHNCNAHAIFLQEPVSTHACMCDACAYAYVHARVCSAL